MLSYCFFYFYPMTHSDPRVTGQALTQRSDLMSSHLQPLHTCMTPYSIYILISLWFSILKLPFSTSHSSMVVGLKLLHKTKTCSKTGEAHNTGNPLLSPHCYKVSCYFSNHINKSFINKFPIYFSWDSNSDTWEEGQSLASCPAGLPCGWRPWIIIQVLNHSMGAMAACC